MDLLELEKKLKIEFPKRHKEALMDLAEPIHKECDFLIPSSPNESLELLGTNEWIHSSKFFNPWPDFLVAFASNGCGDYFAYDLRHKPYTVIYIDPDRTVEENLGDSESLRYDSFEKWYEAKVNLRSTPEYKALFEE